PCRLRLALRPGGCLYLGSCVNTKSGGCWWLGWSRSNSVNVITEYALGRRVLPVNADACGELAQRRGLASFGGQQVGDHRTHQGWWRIQSGAMPSAVSNNAKAWSCW